MSLRTTSLRTMSLRTWFRIALAAISLAVLPSILSAQNSGVAGDGTVRLMFRGTDSSIQLYAFDSSNTQVTKKEYGPFPGLVPVAMTTASNGNTYVLWRNTGVTYGQIGSVLLWVLDTNLDYVNSRPYGPFAGYTAESLSVDTSNTTNG